MVLFCPHVDSFYVRVFFFYFGYELKAKAVKAALTAEQKGIDLFIDDQPFDYPAQPCSQFLGFVYLPVPEETAGFLLHMYFSKVNNFLLIIHYLSLKVNISAIADYNNLL